MKTRLKAAVTGASGFLGSRIARDLEKAGWTVYALTSKPSSLSIKSKNIVPIYCDWKKQTSWPSILKRVDLCVHAAAKVDLKDQNLHDLYQANIFLTASLSEFLKKESKARMVLLSSVSVYGSSQAVSLETQPIPSSHYGLSKLLSEKACLEALKNRCAVLRLAGMWGKEREPSLFINRLIQQAAQKKDLTIHGSGEGKRNYLWAGDLTPILLKAWKQKWNGVRLAASREILSIREMAEEIAGQCGVKLNFSQSHKKEPDTVADVSPDLPPCTAFSTALRQELSQ